MRYKNNEMNLRSAVQLFEEVLFLESFWSWFVFLVKIITDHKASFTEAESLNTLATSGSSITTLVPSFFTR